MRNGAIVIGASLIQVGVLAAADLKDCNLELRLEDALVRAPDARSELQIELQVRDGKLEAGFVRGRGMNQGRHVGVICSGAIQGGRLAIEVDLTVKPDLWLTGGKATYSIQAQLGGGDKTFAGSYSGTYAPVQTPPPVAPRREAAQPVEAEPVPPEIQKLLEQSRRPADVQPVAGAPVEVRGKVTGAVLEPWPGQVKGHEPVQAGEHPRLIFRKADLARLRTNAQTPEGKAIMDRFWKVLDYTAHNDSYKFDSWPGIGYGFAYQMTGERKYADKARQVMQAKFFDRRPIGGQDIHHAPQLQGLALTFDLCYEAWDEDFRRACVDEIWQRTQECIMGTAGGSRMGGLNLAYWSNHNGIRVAGAGLGALAIWREKTSAGLLLDEQALRIAEEAAYDACGWLRDGCGGGAWFMEGLFYKGMTLVRGLAHFLHAYPVAMGRRINAGTLGDHLIAGHFIEADPGTIAVGISPSGVLAGSSGIDSDSWAELIWTIGLSFVPQDMMPGVKYLQARTVGLQGDGSFGLARACYAPYLLACYPFDVPERHPGQCLRWMSPDPVNGHWVFRPAWKDRQDIVLSWNMLTHVRGSCHYERVGPALDWQLRGFGASWPAGRFQPTVQGKENVLARDPMGARLVAWRTEGRTAVMTFDLTGAYMPLLERKRGSTVPWDALARQAGGFRATEVPDGLGMRADMGVSGLRHVAVDCSGDSGAPLLVAVVDEIQARASADGQPAPAAMAWRLPLAGRLLEAQGHAFTMAKGEAVLHGVVLGGGPVGKPDGTVECKDGKVLAVFVLQKAPAAEFRVEGEGLAAKVTLGKRTVRYEKGRLVLE